MSQNKTILSLKEYKKINARESKTVVTTVSLRLDQVEYLKEQNVNISELLRDLLDQTIKYNKAIK